MKTTLRQLEVAKKWIKANRNKRRKSQKKANRKYLAKLAKQGIKPWQNWPSQKKDNEEAKKKQRARNIVSHQKKVGNIKKEPCKECCNVLVEAHHSNYDEPLSIIWLCRDHHAKIHRKYK